MEKEVFDDFWYWYLTDEWRTPPPRGMMFVLGMKKKIYGVLPSDPHCFECGIPMAGIGGNALRFMGSRPSTFSSKLCSACEKTAREQESGAEVELTMLFADVRDSTPLAEKSTTSAFKDVIQRFYKETSNVLVAHNAMVNRLMGDQVSALFVPRFAGREHAKAAVHAAQELLRVTGHGDTNGPWIPVGAGIHTGLAYVGAVGSGTGVNEIAVLGSAANLCARLSSRAAAGEILISEESVKSGNLDVEGLQSRTLELKGITDLITVRVTKV